MHRFHPTTIMIADDSLVSQIKYSLVFNRTRIVKEVTLGC